MKLIVGLGNPGKEYQNTRHNIGFRFIDNFADKNNIRIEKEKFNGLYTKTIIENETVILLKPLSYMNLSGEVIKKFVDYYKIKVEDILVINDDLDLNLAKFRLRRSGSSGGHNGLKNIELCLQTNNFKRLKIGISNNKQIETKDYVLGSFSKEEENKLIEIYNTINNLLFDFLKVDFELLMSKYNNN